jgi:hypothetical protein
VVVTLGKRNTSEAQLAQILNIFQWCYWNGRYRCFAVEIQYIMRYAPHTPDFFNRDRFVLSNGSSPKLQEGYEN